MTDRSMNRGAIAAMPRRDRQMLIAIIAMGAITFSTGAGLMLGYALRAWTGG